MEVKRDLLNHFKYIQNSLRDVNGEAFLNMQTFVLELRLGNRLFKLYPQFVIFVDGNIRYRQAFDGDVIRFAGWHLSANRDPFSFGQKLKFKRLLIDNGFATPAYSTDVNGAPKNILIKKNVSTFGEEIHGPFCSAHDYDTKTQDGEYYEQFMAGEIIKIWYWNHRPVCLEIKEMPAIQGDGKSSIAELIGRKLTRNNNKPNLKKVEDFLRFDGKSMDFVLANGQHQVIDFRYTSDFCLSDDIEEVNLSTSRDSAHEVILRKLGELLWRTLQGEHYGNTVYTVDAIADSENRLWFLEANPNPFIHPYCYPSMIRGLVEEQQVSMLSALVNRRIEIAAAQA